MAAREDRFLWSTDTGLPDLSIAPEFIAALEALDDPAEVARLVAGLSPESRRLVLDGLSVELARQVGAQLGTEGSERKLDHLRSVLEHKLVESTRNRAAAAEFWLGAARGDSYAVSTSSGELTILASRRTNHLPRGAHRERFRLSVDADEPDFIGRVRAPGLRPVYLDREGWSAEIRVSARAADRLALTMIERKDRAAIENVAKALVDAWSSEVSRAKLKSIADQIAGAVQSVVAQNASDRSPALGRDIARRA